MSLRSLFLPWIRGGIKKALQSPAYQLAERIIYAEWQQRRNPEVHPLLMQIAQKKADEMSRLNYFGHTSPSGQTVNELIRENGYRLPDWYPQEGNSCESIRLGADDIAESIQSWLNSPPHYTHIVGASDFFAHQECVGAGTAPDPDGGQIWVFLSAPRQE